MGPHWNSPDVNQLKVDADLLTGLETSSMTNCFSSGSGCSLTHRFSEQSLCINEAGDRGRRSPLMSVRWSRVENLINLESYSFLAVEKNPPSF